MLKKIFAVLAIFATTTVCGSTMQNDIDKATIIIREFKNMHERSIPSEVLSRAKGVAIISVLKGGFIFSGRIGSGIVVAHTEKGWSAPSAIGIAGAGWGLQIGAKVTDFVFILNTQSAVDAFASGGSISLGGDLSIAAGPIGRTAQLDVTLPLAMIYSYSRSKGAFAGASVEGTILLTRRDVNEAFYNKPVTARELLSGDVSPPKSASALYREL